jgi:hypothetical protein
MAFDLLEALKAEPVTYGKAWSFGPETRGEIAEAVAGVVRGQMVTVDELLGQLPADFRGRFEFRLTLIEER